ncbi:uncharacterized protein LOC125235863 [Leguminivora glycinivorella]|uniref:uncharacterized protein LOC125235863 n=1 Tax=Leguminivora glycinivorella TaxID=1035111 RepID=UPI00200EDDEA|nr:uncharacterized protein LOC125235863 [Leguminivora glycinivorella]
MCLSFNCVGKMSVEETVKCCPNFYFKSWMAGKLRNKLYDVNSLRRGAGVNVQDDNGYTPLHHACMNGHREIVHLLLKVDASPCVVDKKGATPLHLAAWKGDSHVVSMLLGHCNPPVNIDQKTNDQETALLIAAQFGHVDVVAQLIAKGADVSLKNNKEESPLDLASQYGKLETVVQLINAHPQLLDPYRFPIGRGRSFPTTPLHRATMNGNKEVVAYLIDAGMDPNVRTENGTALHEGIRYLQASVVKVLLSKGADLKAKDRQGNSVHALLAKYPEDATKKVKKYIREYENQIKISYESEEDLPRIPVNDYPSPVGGYVNAHMIRVLPKLGTNPDACTNKSIKKRVFNTSSSLKRSMPPFKRASTKIMKTTAEIPPKKEANTPDSPGLQPNYVNYEDMLTDETEAVQDVPANNEIYGNLPNVNSTVDKESEYNMELLAGSQNSLKKKPKPPPKPLNQFHKQTLSINELVQKIDEVQLRYSNKQDQNDNSPQVDGNIEPIDDAYVIYGNLPDDEKVKRNGDADSKVENNYPLMNKNHVNRRSVPNYVDMAGNKVVVEDIYSEYISMDQSEAKKRLSLSDSRQYVMMKGNPNFAQDAVDSDSDYIPMDNAKAKKSLSLIEVKNPTGNCLGVHTKGEKGCIYNPDDYEYQYVLKPRVSKGDVSPFIKKKSKVVGMPCYCHEEAAKRKEQEIYYSCEQVYVVVDKNKIYTSLNDVSVSDDNDNNKSDDIPTKLDLTKEEKQFEPFNNTPGTSTSSDDNNTQNLPRIKRFSSVFKKKMEQAKQFVTEW